MAEGTKTWDGMAVPLLMPSTIKIHEAGVDGLTVRYANASEYQHVHAAAGSVAMVHGYFKNDGAVAITGTVRGVRGQATTLVASTDGTFVGVAGRAANGSSTVATDGVSVGTLIGVDALVAGVGQSGPAVITAVRGIYVQLDIDAANLTITDARGIYVNVQSGNASANTLTTCNLMYLEYESVVGTAPAINSAIKIAAVGGVANATCLIDASTFPLAVSDTDKVLIMKFRDSAGTVKNLLYDTGTPAFSFT